MGGNITCVDWWGWDRSGVRAMMVMMVEQVLVDNGDDGNVMFMLVTNGWVIRCDWMNRAVSQE